MIQEINMLTEFEVKKYINKKRGNPYHADDGKFASGPGISKAEAKKQELRKKYEDDVKQWGKSLAYKKYSEVGDSRYESTAEYIRTRSLNRGVEYDIRAAVRRELKMKPEYEDDKKDVKLYSDDGKVIYARVGEKDWAEDSIVHDYRIDTIYSYLPYPGAFDDEYLVDLTDCGERYVDQEGLGDIFYD